MVTEIPSQQRVCHRNGPHLPSEWEGVPYPIAGLNSQPPDPHSRAGVEAPGDGVKESPQGPSAPPSRFPLSRGILHAWVHVSSATDRDENSRDPGQIVEDQCRTLESLGENLRLNLNKIK